VRLARPDTKPATIGLSPLIDVVFLLLIFFVVTTSFAARQVPLTLPEAEQSGPTTGGALGVAIDADGAVAIEAIPALLRARAPEAVIVHADSDTAHGVVVRVLDAARRANVADVGIAVEGVAPEVPPAPAAPSGDGAPEPAVSEARPAAPPASPPAGSPPRG